MISFSRHMMRLLRKGKSLNNERAGSSHAQNAFIRTRRRAGDEKRMERTREMKGANDLKYVVFTARWWTAATGCPAAIRVYAFRTCESRGMKIYHTVFITVDAIVGSNYVWREALDFSRVATIYIMRPREIEESRRAMMRSKMRVLRSTATLSASKRRRRRR